MLDLSELIDCRENDIDRKSQETQHDKSGLRVKMLNI